MPNGLDNRQKLDTPNIGEIRWAHPVLRHAQRINAGYRIIRICCATFFPATSRYSIVSF